MVRATSDYLDALKQVGAKFTKTTGQSISFIDRSGEWMYSPDVECFTSFCRCVITSEKGRQLCCECNNAFERTQGDSIDVSQCHMGVSMVSVPIRSESYDLILSYGQFLQEETKQAFYDSLEKNSMRLGIDCSELRRLASGLRVFNQVELEEHIELLKLFSNYVNATASEVQARDRYYREYQEKISIESRLDSLEANTLTRQINALFTADTISSMLEVAYRERASETASLLNSLLYLLLKGRRLEQAALGKKEIRELSEELVRFQRTLGQLQGSHSRPEMPSTEPACGMGKTVSSACAIIAARYAEPLTLDCLARELYLSPVYLSRIFKKETGKNFKEYLTEVRISKARELLKDESLTVNEVAELVGYRDPGYFGRAFKQKYGYTPRAKKS